LQPVSASISDITGRGTADASFIESRRFQSSHQEKGHQEMKAAFAVWDQRIAPVFDFARRILLVEVESGRVVGEARELLPGESETGKGLRLVELGVDTLVCGAISRPMQAMVAAHGIRVIPFVGGDLKEVIQAWVNGRLQDGLFVMPGCRGRGGRFGHKPGFVEKEDVMKERNRGGIGSGSGQGRGRGGQGFGRMGGPSAAGPGGDCVCPQCGRKEPHERGVPCMRKQCPACGVAMTRS
jgi:predicted Fe-Mo cluster-binding NifX family protein